MSKDQMYSGFWQCVIVTVFFLATSANAFWYCSDNMVQQQDFLSYDECSGILRDRGASNNQEWYAFGILIFL